MRAASEADFMAAYGHLFEHSPWVVGRAWSKRPFADAEGLHRALIDVLGESTEDERLGLLRAHPELADKVAMADGLTADSAGEQASAGLDRLSPAEYREFHELNRSYRAAHGIPFIVCVRLWDKAAILGLMRTRVGNPSEVETAEALRQVGLIAQVRLYDATADARP